MWSPLSAKPAAGFTKIIIGFSMMIMAVLLFLTSWVYRFYGEEMEKQIYSANREQLRQTSVMVEFLSEYAQSVLMSVKMNPSIYYLGSNSGVQDLRLREALNQLDTIRLTSPEVYSIYIYNVEQQVIYTSGSNEQATIHDANSFYDQEFIELAASLDDTQPYYTPYPHSVPVWNPNNENYTLDIYTYLYFDRYYSGKINNVVAVNFSSSWINKSIGYFNNPTEMSNYINIVDNEGKLVFSQNSEEVTPEEEQEYIQKVLNSSDKDGYFLQEINGEMKLISYVVPETWGYDTWRFVSIADYHSVFINQISAQRILTIVSAAAIFFVLALIFIMSHRLRRPFQQLFSKIEAFEKQDKLHFRHNRIHFLSQLLTGHYAKETVNEDLERYHFSFDPQASLRVIAIQKKKTSDQLSGNEWKELFEKEWKSYSTRFETFSSSEENLFIITESDDSREHLQYLKELLEDIQAELYKHTENLQLCITISSCGHTYRDLPFLYREALKLQSCFFTLGYQHIVTEEDNQNETTGFVYPIDIEKNLLHNAFRGREEIALQYFDSFCEAICRGPAEYVKSAFICLAYNTKHYESTHPPVMIDSIADMDAFISNLQEKETLQEVQEVFLSVLSEIIQSTQEQTRMQYIELVEKIKNYVDAHYQDSNLSINDIADEMDMSSAYIGRLFKQYTSQTFIEYLTEYRMNQACQLLVSGNDTINEIAEKTGFASNTYFFHLFKKKYQTTPAKFRQEARKQEQEANFQS